MVGTAISRSNACCADGAGARSANEISWTLFCQSGTSIGRLVDRGFVGQRAIRHVGDERAALVNLQPRAFGDLADLHRVQVPLLEHRFDFVLAAALDDEQHALLRLGQHDLVRGHAGLTLRHVA